MAEQKQHVTADDKIRAEYNEHFKNFKDAAYRGDLGTAESVRTAFNARMKQGSPSYSPDMVERAMLEFHRRTELERYCAETMNEDFESVIAFVKVNVKEEDWAVVRGYTDSCFRG